VSLEGIVKRYPGVVANDGAALVVRPGEVHALVGENGSGKSTLMKVLSGALRPDAGTIRIDGRAVRFGSPRSSIRAGIGLVHQHSMLADNLSVLENVIVGAEPTRWGHIDLGVARRRIHQLSSACGLPVSADSLVEDLGVAERQRVELVKVLYRGARTLLLDEPTAVLMPRHAEALLATLSQLAAQGLAVVLVSHQLDEVCSVADTITVMRAGRTVASIASAEADVPRLIELVVGGQLSRSRPVARPVGGPVELAVSGLGIDDRFGHALVEDVSFSVRRGEVLGIAGLEGDGQRELVEGLVGLRALARGTVVLGEYDITNSPTRARRRHGLGYVPEDRQRDGLLPTSPLWENAALGHHTAAPFARGRWFDRLGARRRTADICRDFGIRGPGVDIPARALSGGNRQKLILGREMIARPRVLIAAQPTRGVDVAARGAIHAAIDRARGQGMAQVLVSTDLEELLGLCDAVLVLRRGRVVARTDPRAVTVAQLQRLMIAPGRPESP
jgi:simple sugar transport system ATP-binding protein